MKVFPRHMGNAKPMKYMTPVDQSETEPILFIYSIIKEIILAHYGQEKLTSFSGEQGRLCVCVPPNRGPNGGHCYDQPLMPVMKKTRHDTSIPRSKVFKQGSMFPNAPKKCVLHQ